MGGGWGWTDVRGDRASERAKMRFRPDHTNMSTHTYVMMAAMAGGWCVDMMGT